MNYRNLTINEQTTYQDNVFESVYLMITDLSINSYNEKKAQVLFSLYKSKQTAETHPEWAININEFDNITITFVEGDVINRDTIAGGVKQALCRMFPSWNPDKIVIE